jgi:hypothetical protein
MTRDAGSTAHDFFDAYRAAFETLEPDEISGYFAYPCHVTSDAGTPHLSAAHSREEWREQIAQLVALYEQVGVASARALSITENELSPRVVLARVHWVLRDEGGAELYEFHALYTLVRTEAGFKIAALAHDELPQLLRLVAARQ